MADTNDNSGEVATENVGAVKRPGLKDLPKEELLKLLKKAKMKCDDLNKKCIDLELKHEKEHAEIRKLMSANGFSTFEEFCSEWEELQLNVKDISSEKKVLHAEKESLSSALAEKATEIDLLKGRIKVVTTDKEALARRFQEADEQVQCMQMKLGTLTQTCKFLQEEVSRLNEVNSDLQKEVGVLSQARDTALEALKKVKEDHQVQAEKWQKIHDNLEAELATHAGNEGSIQALGEKSRSLESQLNEAMQKYQVACEENSSLKLQLEKMQSEIDSLNKESDELDALKEKLLESEKKSRNLEEEVSSLSEKCRRFEDEKLSFDHTYAELCNVNKVLSEKLATAETRIQIMTDEKISDRKQLEQDLLCARSKIEELIENNAHLEAERHHILQDLNECKSEKNVLLTEVESALQGMLLCCDDEEERNIDHIIQLLKYSSIEFNEMKIKLDSLKTEKAESESSVQTEELHQPSVRVNRVDVEMQTEEASSHPLQGESDMASSSGEVAFTLGERSDLELKVTELANTLEEERVRFSTEISEISKKYEDCLEEVETLKQQLDEYESDIQNHQNLESENIQLVNCVKELEKDNDELNECLDNRCAEFTEVCNQIESLLATAVQYAKDKETGGVIPSENDVFENLLALRSLWEEMAMQKSLNAEELGRVESELMEAVKSKQNLSAELEQIKSLNQFLEDEVKELREESEEMSSRCNSTLDAATEVLDEDIENSSGPKEGTYGMEQEYAESCIQTDCIASCDSSVQLNTSELEGNKGSNQPEIFPCAVSEWGYAENDFSLSSKDSIIIGNLRKENENLKSLLEMKSSLVEKIHCEVDLLLSKVEELTEDLEHKNSDLLLVREKNTCLEADVKALQDQLGQIRERLAQTLSFTVSQKEMLSSVLQQVYVCKEFCKSTVSDVEKRVNEIKFEFENCCTLLDVCRAENASMRAEIDDIHTLSCTAWREVLSLSRMISSCHKEDKTCVNDKHSEETPSETDTECSKVILQKLLLGLSGLHNTVSDISSQLQKAVIGDEHNDVSHYPEKQKDVQMDSAILSGTNHHVGKSVKIEEGETEFSQIKCGSCEVLRGELVDCESKMNKFKAIAVRMKKELASTTQMYRQITQQKENLEKELQMSNDELNTAHSLQKQYVQNFQNLQNEYDKLQDDFENLKKENKSLQGELAERQSELSKCREKLSELELSLKKTQKQLDLVETEKSQSVSKNADFESRVIVLQTKNSELQQKVQQLTIEISKVQREASEAMEEREHFKKELENALKEGSKHSLLDLEMADYERTISELTAQLEVKTDETKDLKKDIEDQISKIFSLQEEIKFSESCRRTEEMRAESFKQALENTKKELSIVREQESELKDDVASLNSKVETLSLLEDDYKAQISKQSVEIEHLKDMLKSSGENHQRIVQNLNSKIAAQKQEIVMAHKEVESVKQSFENYKTRVHNVLKQQKNVTPFSASDAEVKEKLEAQNEKLKLQVKDLSEKLEVLTLESESLRDEHEHLLQRQAAVIEELEAKDRQWSLRLEQVNIEKSRLEALLEDRASQYTLQAEMLAATYKKQIKMMQEQHKSAVEELQKQLESADMEISRLQREQQVSSIPALVTNNEDSFSFDILSQERQEGEGSECTEGGNTPVKPLSLVTIPSAGFLPLDKLLQSPAESETPTSVLSGHESEKLSSDLSASLKKIDHLSELLNESEANNLHLSEQVRVLKEELRRLERNKQREAHAENLEYLKNVVIKFATLQPGSEKVTLVPVLNTILKLSPEELQKLKSVAGDDDGTPDPSSSGWSSYLHRWSGVM